MVWSFVVQGGVVQGGPQDPACFPHAETIKEMTAHMVLRHGDQVHPAKHRANTTLDQ